jgi:hypothetical protein
MTRMFFLAALAGCLAVSPAIKAHVVDATVFEIVTNPQSFDGKMVRVKAVVTAGFEEFAIRDSGCGPTVSAVWLAYPKGTGAKAGPAALLRLNLAKNSPASVASVSRTPVKLEKNKEFKDFDKSLSTPAKASGLCLGCIKYTVTATLVGRIDGARDTGLIRGSDGKVTGVSGFGNLNRYNARMVLQSVSGVVTQEIERKWLPLQTPLRPPARRTSQGHPPLTR